VIAKRMLHTRSREAMLQIANDYEQMIELLAKQRLKEGNKTLA
jgi:hypothetical protein